MNRTLRASGWMITIALGWVLIASPPALAGGVDISFGASIPIGDEGALYFAISSRYFDQEPEAVRHVAIYYDDPDDLAVALFISRHSGRNADDIWKLRRQGKSWWQISAQFNLAHDLWFVPVKHAPGPPYGKAYGYWKKHRHDRHATFVLSDADARNLVAVRVISDYYGISIESAMEKRSSGNLRHVLAREYRSRHPHGKTPKHGGGHPGKHGKGHEKHKR